MTTLTTLDCGHPESPHSEITTGYGVTQDGRKICYSCCAEQDKQQMRQDGRITLYLVERDGRHYVTNWPGSLEIPVKSFRKSHHNMAGKNGRTDVWFTFEGQNWHGYQIGQWNEICHCKRTK